MNQPKSVADERDNNALLASLAAHRHLSDFEYLMLRGESDPRGRSSGIAVLVLDIVPEWERFQKVFERASRVYIRMRQKVVAPLLPIGPAEWVVDPDFDVNQHVRRIVLPAPGTMRQLLDLAAQEYARPYDIARPLWDILLIEGLTDPAGPAAMIYRFHHAISDGVGSVELSKQIYDFERELDRGPMPPLPVPEDLEPVELTRRQIRGLPFAIAARTVRLAGTLTRVGRRAVTAPGATLHEFQRAAEVAQKAFAGSTVEPSPLLRRRGIGRRFDFVEFPLDRFRRAARAGHGSVNDAFISAVSGVLGRYHEELGVPLDTLPLSMPVSIRKPGDSAGGNQWTGVGLAAPIGVKDPVKRIEIIHSQVVEALADTAAFDMLSLFAPVAARIPPAVLSALASNAVGGHDVQASNVPGYVELTYIAGARIVKNLPFGPLPGVPIMFTLYTEGGHCCVGINYDTVSFADHDLLARCLREGFDEVLALDPQAPDVSAGLPESAPESAPASAPASAPTALPTARKGTSATGSSSRSAVRAAPVKQAARPAAQRTTKSAGTRSAG
jgi:diacylglycerol O-acyltransferase / wax synthase